MLTSARPPPRCFSSFAAVATMRAPVAAKGCPAASEEPFGLIFAGAFTAGLEFNDIGGWWDEPILYQKLMIWTILLEILGLAATCGPLAFHFDPPIGGVLYWWQTDTLRVPPYPNTVPFTKGNRRTPWDTGLYKLIVFWLITCFFAVPGFACRPASM